MIHAKRLFEEGKVRDAQRVLSEWLRSHPADAAQRTFLFELLCFSGDWDRAERQLKVLAEGSGEREWGAVLYFSALHAERSRHEMFEQAAWPVTEAGTRMEGTVNGRRFQAISDADPVIGARLEIFAAGSYLWLPFEHIRRIRIEAPRKLRDTLWLPAAVRTTPAFREAELGEVLIPAVYPFSWRERDEAVWLGRETRWIEDSGRERPVGQKMLWLDDEAVPLLEIRELDLEKVEVAGHA